MPASGSPFPVLPCCGPRPDDRPPATGGSDVDAPWPPENSRPAGALLRESRDQPQDDEEPQPGGDAWDAHPRRRLRVGTGARRFLD